MTGLPGPDPLAELTAEVRRSRPPGDPFDIIVELVPDRTLAPWLAGRGQVSRFRARRGL